MTAGEVIQYVDNHLHNVYSPEDKLLWLTQLEHMTAALRERCGLTPRPADLTQDSVLTVPKPHDRMYAIWLEAQIDYANQEYLRYNNAMELFMNWWRDYANTLRRARVTPSLRKFY